MKTYIAASFSNPIPSWLRKNTRALRQLSYSGVDLKKAVFHHEPIGRGKSYPVYAIRDGNSEDLIVWIPGIYNDEARVSDPYNGGYTSIKYVPKKYLDIVDIVYVSKETTKPSKERYQDPRYTASGKYRGQTYDEYSKSWKQPRIHDGNTYDKSGYKIPDPKTLIANWYSQGNFSRLKARIERAYKSLRDIHSKIIALDFDEVDPEDYTGSRYRNLMSGFGDAVGEYRRFLYRYKNKIESDNAEPWEISTILQQLFSLERHINDLQRYYL